MPVDTCLIINAIQIKNNAKITSRGQLARELTITILKKKQKNKIRKTKKVTLKIKIMDPVTIGALVGGGASAFNAVSQSIQNRANRRFSREMFDKTNAYNTPAQQIKRMKEAGLNPALMYQGTPQNTAQRADVPEGHAPQIDPEAFSKIAQQLSASNLSSETAAQMATKTDLLNTNINLLNTKMDDINSQIKLRNEGQLPNIQADTKLKESNINVNESHITNNQVLADKIVQETKNLKQQYTQSSQLFPISKQHQQATINSINAETNRVNQQIKAFPAQQQLVLQKMKAEIKQLGSNVTSAQIEQVLKRYEVPFAKAGLNPHASGTANIISNFVANGIMTEKPKYIKNPRAGQKGQDNYIPNPNY
jgi:hypothetical protein